MAVKTVAIKKQDNFYFFKFDDAIELTCVLVDYAENPEINLNWNDIIEVIYRAKTEDEVVMEV